MTRDAPADVLPPADSPAFRRASAAVAVPTTLLLALPLTPLTGTELVLGPPVIVSYALTGLALSLRTGFDHRLAPTMRRPWRWVAAGVLALVLQAAIFAATGWTFTVWGSILRCLAPVCVLKAILAFPAPPRARSDWLSLYVDTLMPAGAAGMALWYFLLGPALVRGADLADVLAMIAAPVTDLVLVCGACLVLLRGTFGPSRRPVLLLLLAFALLAVPDLNVAYHVAHGAYEVGHDVPLTAVIPLLLGFGVLMMAAASGRVAPGHDRAAADAPRHVAPYLPYVAVAVGYGLMISVALRTSIYPWGGLSLGMIVMTCGLVLRQIMQQRESHRVATTDALTGLANRRSLLDGLSRRARDSAGTACLLLDLDGFKAINDTLGHAVGDAALQEVAQALTRSVLGRDLVARLGGDEFAVVLSAVLQPAQAVAVAERILADMAKPRVIAGHPVTLRTSIGIALGSSDGFRPHELLRRADLAMYDAKRGGTSSWVVHADELEAAATSEADGQPATANTP